MATHSSILAWEIPWTGEPGGLQSMGSQKSQTQLSDQTTTAAIHFIASGELLKLSKAGATHLGILVQWARWGHGNLGT